MGMSQGMGVGMSRGVLGMSRGVLGMRCPRHGGLPVPQCPFSPQRTPDGFDSVPLKPSSGSTDLEL